MPYIFITNSMKLKSLIALIFALCLFQPQLIEAQKKRSLKKTANTNLTARQIADKVLPSVVLIITQDENGNPISQGSGFVIGQGLVVSNLHVFERATSAIVKNVKTGEVSKAIEVVGMNAKEDICVIRIDDAKFPVLPLGDSSSIQTGDEIYVASNPKGLEGSFTKGIISSLRSDVGLFQIDAAISSGSSGGVLLNQKAEAVGIIKSSLVSGQNLNFAIPINKLKALKYIFKNSIQLAGACAYRDREKEKLKGVVKSVTQLEKSPYMVEKNGKYFKDEEYRPIFNSIYDLEGNQIEYLIYSLENQPALKLIITHDENRLLTSIVIKKDLTAKDLGVWNETSIRANSILKKLNIIDSGERILNLKESTDLKISIRGFSNEVGDLNESYGLSVFNSEGELVKINSKQGVNFVYNYDNNDRLKESEFLNNGKIFTRSKYNYKDDSHGNWIERKEYTNMPEVNSDDWSLSETVYREITYYE
jgi:Trypsin-like peptidase domain